MVLQTAGSLCFSFATTESLAIVRQSIALVSGVSLLPLKFRETVTSGALKLRVKRISSVQKKTGTAWQSATTSLTRYIWAKTKEIISVLQTPISRKQLIPITSPRKVG